MKASELRIGNLVTVNNPEHWPLLKNVPLIVEGINKCKPIESIQNTDYNVQLFDNSDFKTRYFATKTFSQFICFVEPITLDEDWLLRFGFEWKNNGLRNKKICIRQLGGAYCLFLSNESLNFEKRFEFVHQLQNLYFDFVGEELVLQD